MKIKQTILIAAFLFFVHLTFGQTSIKGNFSFHDKYGCLINVRLYKGYPILIDSSFIVNNISGKVIFPSLDSVHCGYEFSILRISALENLKFELEVYVKVTSIMNQNKDSVGVITLSHKKKLAPTFGDNIYIMSLKKSNDNLIIEKFEYLNSKI